MQHNYQTPQIKPSYIQIKNTVDNEGDSSADTFNDQDLKTTSQKKNYETFYWFFSFTVHLFVSIT